MRQARRPRYLLGKSASDGFAAVSNAVAAMWAARFVHRFNHAGFQQRARRGEGDFVRGFVFRAVVPPFFRTVSFVFMSHLAALDGEIGEWMAGEFLALAQVGK